MSDEATETQAAPEPVTETAPVDNGAPREITEADLEAEFGQDPSPATEADDASLEEEEAPTERKGKSVQERMDEMTAARREAERTAEAERRRADEAERALAEYRTGSDDGDELDPNAEPDPANYEFGEADLKYISDRATWSAMSRIRAEQEEAAFNTQLKTLDEGWQKQMAEATEKYPDFQKVVVESANSANPAWKCSDVMLLAMQTSDHGADLAYHLASNPTESQRIWDMHPLEAAREMGRLEGRFMKPSADAPKPKIASEAPPPPGGKARGDGGRFAVAADTDDFAAFDKMADSIIAKR